MCRAKPEVGKGGRGDVYLYRLFLPSSLCLLLANRLGYGYLRGTTEPLENRDHLPKKNGTFVQFWAFAN